MKTSARISLTLIALVSSFARCGAPADQADTSEVAPSIQGAGQGDGPLEPTPAAPAEPEAPQTEAPQSEAPQTEAPQMQEPEQPQPEPSPEPTPELPPAPAPDTQMYGLPQVTNRVQPRRVLISSLPGSSFMCSTDGAAYTPCEQNAATETLAAGEHTLSAYAIANGVADPTPVTKPVRVSTKPMLRYDFSSGANSTGEYSDPSFSLSPFPFFGEGPAINNGVALTSQSQSYSVTGLDGTALGNTDQGTLMFTYKDLGSTATCSAAEFLGPGNTLNVLRHLGGKIELCATPKNGATVCSKSTMAFANGSLTLTLRYARTANNNMRFDLYLGTNALTPLATLSAVPMVSMFGADGAKSYSFGNGCTGSFDNIRFYDAIFTDATLCSQVWGGYLSDQSCVFDD